MCPSCRAVPFAYWSTLPIKTIVQVLRGSGDPRLRLAICGNVCVQSRLLRFDACAGGKCGPTQGRVYPCAIASRAGRLASSQTIAKKTGGGAREGQDGSARACLSRQRWQACGDSGAGIASDDLARALASSVGCSTGQQTWARRAERKGRPCRRSLGEEGGPSLPRTDD